MQPRLNISILCINGNVKKLFFLFKYTCVTNVKSKLKVAGLNQQQKKSLPIFYVQLCYTPPSLYPPSAVIDWSRDETERSATNDIS